METVYIAVEKNKEVFELYKELWRQRCVNGIIADSMTEAIERAAAIKKSKNKYLYFISISANDIDYMKELPILSEASEAPILIATSHDNEDEHHEAIKRGAIFYGQFCEAPEKNVRAVETYVNRYYLTIGKKVPENVIAHNGVSISLSQRSVHFKGAKVELTTTEFNVLSYLFENRGTALPYNQIYEAVWKEKSGDTSIEAVKSAVKRIRKKLGEDGDANGVIENLWGYGYKVPV